MRKARSGEKNVVARASVFATLVSRAAKKFAAHPATSRYPDLGLDALSCHLLARIGVLLETRRRALAAPPWRPRIARTGYFCGRPHRKIRQGWRDQR